MQLIIIDSLIIYVINIHNPLNKNMNFTIHTDNKCVWGRRAGGIGKFFLIECQPINVD